jgi:hypothetical protein
MKNKAWLFWQKNYLVVVLSLIILLGAFLRLYHFSDWLHFELDQSRDAKVIDLALEEGIGNLPLLGPKAAGSFLRLGPAFYYFQYLSALVFGATPSGMAMIMAIFGIGAIPLFYFLVKRYFANKLSLALTFLFSISLFLIMYSRFSWNPNALPFFVLLTFLAMLRSVDPEEPRKKWWLVVFFASLAIATQLHFLAFVALPVIAFFFFLARLPKVRWYFWVIGISAVLLLYLPLILNDIKTGGDNFGQFLKVAEGRSTKDSHSIPEKLVRNYSEQALGFWLILSGEEKAAWPKFTLSGWNPQVVCDQTCHGRLVLGGLAGTFFTLGIFSMLLNFFRLRKEAGKRKDFLFLSILWFAVIFAFYTPIAYDISPRFLLLIAPLPFIFLGFLMELGKKYLPNRWKYLLVILIVILALMNLRAIQKRFGELEKAPMVATKIDADKILKEKMRVTLKQQYLIVDYMKSFYQENNFPVYLNSDSQYRRSFLYHLDRRHIPRDDLRNATNNRKIYQNGNYFLIYPTLSNLEKKVGKYLTDYTIIDEKEFGTLKVFHLAPKPEAVTDVQQSFGPEKKPTSALGVPVRCRWNEIFGECNPDEIEDATDNAEEN